MPEIPAPALRGNDPLGFLAALGVLALSEQGEIQPLRLRWEGGTAPHAVFVSGAYHGTRDLADALREVARRLLNADAAIPGCPPEFPYRNRHPADTAKGADPMRMSREAARATCEDAARRWESRERWFARWVAALVAPYTLDKDGPEGRIRLTPFNAPFGQMKFRDSYYDQACRCVAATPGMPEDAFVGWIRLEGYTGANLDARAIREAQVSTAGVPSNAGAPSPTWLAVMAIRFFPLADDGRLRTAGWQEVQLYSGATRRSLVWPVWRPPLDAPSVRVLLNHPDLAVQVPTGGTPRVAGGARLRALGITGVYGSSRRTRTQGDGPLGPAVLLWPAPR